MKILKEIPKLVGRDLKQYGPFKSGDEAELPLEIAKVLMASSKAE